MKAVSEKRRRLLGTASSASASVLFGLSFMFTKQSVDEVSTFTLLSWCFLFSVLFMLLFSALGIFKLRLKGRDLKPLLLIALIQPLLYYPLETYGIALTTSSESGTVLACVPIVTIILSALILKEPPTKLQVGSILVSAAGVIILVLVKGISASFDVIGYVFLVSAMLADSLFVIFTRRAADYGSTEKTFMMSLVGAVVFSAIALVEHAAAGTLSELLLLPFRDRDFLSSVLYLSLFGSVIAFMLCNYGISVIGATRSSSLQALTTLVSVAAGVIFLGEPFSLLQAFATALILLGVYGANRTPKAAGVPAPERN